MSPIYCEPFRNSAQLTVYGVTNMERQEEVLSAAREWEATNPIVSKVGVRFYERENSDGDRRSEKLIREVFVNN